MSEITVRGNSILVNTPESAAARLKSISQQPGEALVSWVVERVTAWREHRDNNYLSLWSKYWRLWRGMWSEQDKNRQSERSRLIAPALAQAIEMSVAEIEEAIFSRANWLDVADDVADQQREDMAVIRDRFLEDSNDGGIQSAVAEGVLNSAICGTGIIKLSPEEIEEEEFFRDVDTGTAKLRRTIRVIVSYTSIRPDEFIPDPAGTTIQEMLGCAHEVIRPMHSVLEKIQRKVYRADALAHLGPYNSPGRAIDDDDPGQIFSPKQSDEVSIIEYHGKVPAWMLEDTAPRSENPIDAILDELSRGGEPRNDRDERLVEAIVTIANESVLLRAMKNPFLKADRSIVAWSYEKVPGRFWGRGVAEKGYNPQLALDTELRARQDALGFVSAPMLAVDSGRVPRGFKMEIKPGKVWLTQGPPDEVLRPVQIGQINGTTFNQTADMERMVQMGTGAFDTASTLGTGATTASGGSPATTGSMVMGAFVKRTKRAIQNLDRHCLQPLVTKSLWRYMQLDPERYPQDIKFQVKATLGLVAREVEQLALTQLMGMLPEEFPQVRIAVAQGIIDLANVHNKPQILAAMNQALQPPSPEQQALQEETQKMQLEQLRAETQGLLLANQKVIAEIREILSKVAVNTRKADTEDDKVAIERQRTVLQAAEIDQFQEQNRIAQKRLELQERQVDARIAQMRQQKAK